MPDLHATAFDLPGWPCPPRVRDIPKHPDSWGWVPVSPSTYLGSVAADELGRLWVDGSATPRFKLPNSSDASPGAVVFWTDHGIGLWVHPKSYQWIADLDTLAAEPDRWIPVAVVLPDLPEFVTEQKGGQR